MWHRLFERISRVEFDRLFRAAGIGNHKVRGYWIEVSLVAFHRSVEAFQKKPNSAFSQ